MDAVEFLKQFNRMCKTYNDDGCTECPAYKYRCGEEFDEQEEAGVSIVEKWAKEHPVKTRQSELLKLFPNMKIDDDTGTLCMCPMNFNPETYKDEEKCFCVHMRDDIHCAECRRDFWLKEIE